MKIQEIIAAFLAAQGQHAEAIDALASVDRTTWLKLVDHAIRTAPEHNKTHVAHVLTYLMDRPENGGLNAAEDFVIKPEPHREQTGVTVYRAWRVLKTGLDDTGLAGIDQDKVIRRVVGLYVARGIVRFA